MTGAYGPNHQRRCPAGRCRRAAGLEAAADLATTLALSPNGTMVTAPWREPIQPAGAIAMSCRGSLLRQWVKPTQGFRWSRFVPQPREVLLVKGRPFSDEPQGP